MSPKDSPARQFEAEIKAAVLRGAMRPVSDSGVNLAGAKSELDDAISTEYHNRTDTRKRVVELARETGDTDTLQAATQNLDRVTDEMSEMFAAGHSRINTAIDAYEMKDITVDIVSYDPEEMSGYGVVDPNELGVEAGDMVPLVRSSSGSRYILAPTETHAVCNGPDKNLNEDFPVCKHEMVWLFTQVELFKMGMRDVLDSEARDILMEVAAESEDISIEQTTPAAPSEMVTPVADD